MTLRLEDLPPPPAKRVSAPRLMTSRRRWLWLALVVIVGTFLAVTAWISRYQPLQQGPAFGPVKADTELWSADRLDRSIYLAEYRDGGSFEFWFSLEHTGRFPVTIEQLYPGHREWCLFNPDTVQAVAGSEADIYSGDVALASLPLAVRPGEQVFVRVAGHVGGAGECQLDGSATFDTVEARIATGWTSRRAGLPLGAVLGFGSDVEEYLTPRRVAP